MLGAISRSYFYVGFWSCNYLCHVPYRWDREKNIPVAKNDFVGHAGWIINIFVTLVCLIWGIVRTCQSYVKLDGTFLSTQYWITTTFLTSTILLPLLAHVDQIRCHEDMLIIYNQFIAYCDGFKGNHRNGTPGRRHWFQIVTQDKVGTCLA
ncbi:unnamed protein product, partial [Allacma fusca]